MGATVFTSWVPYSIVLWPGISSSMSPNVSLLSVEWVKQYNSFLKLLVKVE
jgi:hypothetical protein